MSKFLRVSRRHGDTGETIWVRPGTIRNITLPWRWDVQFNPEAADFPTPYRVAFDGAEGIAHAFTSAEELRAAGITLPATTSYLPASRYPPSHRRCKGLTLRVTPPARSRTGRAAVRKLTFTCTR